jgi:hypothetical protein
VATVVMSVIAVIVVEMIVTIVRLGWVRMRWVVRVLMRRLVSPCHVLSSRRYPSAPPLPAASQSARHDKQRHRP